MKRNRLILLPLLGLALAALACNALASRFQPTPPPVAQGPAPTATQRPAGQGPLKTEGGLTIGSPRETRVAISENAPALEQLAREQYDQEALAEVGKSFTYTIALTQSEQVLWLFGWCATSPELVQKNLEHMTVAFSANGTPLDPGQLFIADGQSGNLPCRYFAAVLYDWPPGETQLETQITFTEKVNDGISDYSPGSQTFIYNVTAP